MKNPHFGLKCLVLVLLYIAFSNKTTLAQTPVNMGSQPGLTYTEQFTDINNWIFSTSPANGVFTAGNGSLPWKGVAINATGTIPDGSRISTATTAFVTGTTGGVQKGSGNIHFLATGSTDNSSSAAMDLHLDFTGLNAGNISFDWSSVFNSTGDRKASLRVYASTNGISFQEITDARISNLTNNVATSGGISGVSLPVSFNGSASAILRFYVHNGSGGTTGSRPKISIDNVTVTAVSTVACTTPASQPTSLVFTATGSSTMQGNFTASVSNPDNYLMLISNNSSLSALPANGATYIPGENIGDASVVSISNTTNFNISGLGASTPYFLFVFSMNSNCTGGPLYQLNNPLTGTTTTTSGNIACAAPVSQATNLVFSNITSSSIQGNFTMNSGTDEWLVIRSTNSSLSANPVNTTTYNAGASIGGGTVVSRTSSNSFIANSLIASTHYYFFVFAINSQNCTGGPIYNVASPLFNSISTNVNNTCATPNYQPNNLVLSGENISISGSFSNVVDAESFIVLYSQSPALSLLPQDNINYTAGTVIGNAIVALNSTSNSFYIYNLEASTQYYFFVFAKNSQCTGGTKYNRNAPLTGTKTTSATRAFNYYFGNLHAHSRYSDGNKDNPTFTPADDFAYAKNSDGMDFLGLSEHNHKGAGMNLSDWHLGLSQAASSTTSNFVALYGQEWGVISGGGHALVYGIDSLIGWEANNYQVFVAKSDYTGTLSTTGTTGLFRTLNQQGNAFATFAHPNSSDFNNISNIAYNATADSAVIGTAIESGPAFSTNTTYSDNPTSFSFLSYYNKMLAKGYHIGPLMDHDTHNTNFGRANENRLVILAPSLTKQDLFSALKARRFYATQDIDTKVVFTINNQPMGSIITGNNSPSIYANATDPTSPSSTPLIKLMYGTPGSGVNPIQLTSVSGFSLTLIDLTIPDGATFFYYLDITINGKRTITAPIWFTRNNCFPHPDNPIVSWTGSSNSTLSNPSNWCGGVVPTIASNIIIRGTAINMPQLGTNDNIEVNNLIIEPGAAFTIGKGILRVNSTILNNGSLNAGSGTIEFKGTAQQTTPVFVGNTVAKLIINNPAGVVLGSKVLIDSVLTLTEGVLTSNGNLTMKSGPLSNSRIAPVTNGSINGVVTVERYIPGGLRAYRFLTPGVNSVASVKANWQEGSNSSTDDPYPGFGTHITGNPTDQVNGFDGTLSGAASLFQMNNATQIWNSGIQNTNATNLFAGNGYCIFIRGNRSYNLLGSTPPSSTTTTLRSTGNILSGEIIFNKSGSGATPGMPLLAPLPNQYSFLGNPYISPVNWATVSKTDLMGYYYTWDPTLGSRGAYVSCFTDGSKNNISSSVTSNIQPGQAIFVQNASVFSNEPKLVFKESDKATGFSEIFRMQSPPTNLSIELFHTEKLNGGFSQDGANCFFDNNYSNEMNDDDALKMINPDENIGILKGVNTFSIERRKFPVLNSDTIGLKLWRTGDKNYTLRLTANNFNTGLLAVLNDKFLNMDIPLNLGGITEHNFSINTANAQSSQENRFNIIFKQPVVLPVTVTNFKASLKNTGIEIEWSVENELNIDRYTVEKSANGITFSKAFEINANGSTNYLWYDGTPETGNNFYRIKVTGKSGDTKFTRVINVKINQAKSKQIIVTNPVINNMLSLQLNQVDMGQYFISIYNQSGQLVSQNSFTHVGGSASISLLINKNAAGMYRLHITNTKNEVIKNENILIK